MGSSAARRRTDRIDHLYQDPHVDHQRFKLHDGDLTDSTNLTRIIQQVQPDEIYNLASQSQVPASFAELEYTANAHGLGALLLARRYSPSRPGKEDTLPAGQHQRAVWSGVGRIAEGDCAVLPAQPYAVAENASR